MKLKSKHSIDLCQLIAYLYLFPSNSVTAGYVQFLNNE